MISSVDEFSLALHAVTLLCPSFNDSLAYSVSSILRRPVVAQVKNAKAVKSAERRASLVCIQATTEGSASLGAETSERPVKDGRDEEMRSIPEESEPKDQLDIVLLLDSLTPQNLVDADG